MEIKMPPKRIATAIMNSLRGGVVPREGLEYITVGRTSEINALLCDIDLIEDGGAAFRFVAGKYGSGKSFLLQTIRNHVMQRGFVVMDADLSPERRLMGTQGQGLATYRELVRNMSTRTSPDGGALALVLDKWISGLQTQLMGAGQYELGSEELTRAVTAKIYEVIHSIQDMVHGFDFATVLSIYWDASRNQDDGRKAKAIKWFRGEYATKTDARQDLGVSVIISDENWYDYIKILCTFIVKAGYKGLYLLIDELVNLFKIPNSIARQYNYEKILTIYNDTMQGRACNLGVVFCGTPQSIEDTRRGVFSYEALRSRLESGRYATDTTKDLRSPILHLQQLSYEEMIVLIEKLAKMHSFLFGYNCVLNTDDYVSFLKAEYSRIGAQQQVTPREMIRDFIEALNILSQNPELSLNRIIQSDQTIFSQSEITEASEHEAFKEFDL
jgi:hypothetical protein